jgi:hypothetical protein
MIRLRQLRAKMERARESSDTRPRLSMADIDSRVEDETRTRQKVVC